MHDGGSLLCRLKDPDVHCLLPGTAGKMLTYAWSLTEAFGCTIADVY